MAIEGQKYGLTGFGQIGKEVVTRSFAHFARAESDSDAQNTPVIEVINEWESREAVLHDFSDTLPNGARMEIKDGELARVIFPSGRELVIRVLCVRDNLGKIWNNTGVRSVINANRDPEGTAEAQIDAGALEELLTGPSARFPEVLRGISEHLIDPHHKIYSNGSCTSKGAGPVIKKIREAELSGDLPNVNDWLLDGVHSATNTDSFVDRPGKTGVFDNFVGGPTGSTKVLPRVIDGLKALEGSVWRGPISEGSIVSVHVAFDEIVGANGDETRARILAALRKHAPTDPTIVGFDNEREPDVRHHRDDDRPSVILTSRILAGKRSAIIPARYNNVRASANEALLTMQLIRKRLDELRDAA